jgi:hypothetical protein
MNEIALTVTFLPRPVIGKMVMGCIPSLDGGVSIIPPIFLCLIIDGSTGIQGVAVERKMR